MDEVRGWEAVALVGYFCLLAEEKLVQGVHAGAGGEHQARDGDGPFGELLPALGDENYAQGDACCEHDE